VLAKPRTGSPILAYMIDGSLSDIQVNPRGRQSTGKESSSLALPVLVPPFSSGSPPYLLWVLSVFLTRFPETTRHSERLVNTAGLLFTTEASRHFSPVAYSQSLSSPSFSRIHPSQLISRVFVEGTQNASLRRQRAEHCHRRSG